MTKEEKMLKLIPLLNRYVTVENLNRLVEGDLSEVGDYIVNGGTHLTHGLTTPHIKDLTFDAYPRSVYQIPKRKINVNGHIINAPESKAPEEGTFVYIFCFNRGEVLKELWSSSHPVDISLLKNNQIFLTKEDAEAYGNAVKDIKYV